MSVWQDYFCQLILLFNLFLLLFIGPTALFGTIHRSHCTISANYYLYLQFFQQKIFSFNKINGSQTDPKFCHQMSTATITRTDNEYKTASNLHQHQQIRCQVNLAKCLQKDKLGISQNPKVNIRNFIVILHVTICFYAM